MENHPTGQGPTTAEPRRPTASRRARQNQWTRPIRRRPRHRSVAGLVAIAAVGATVLGLTQLTGTGTATATVSGPPAVPSHSAYLGALVAPHESVAQAQDDIRRELSGIANFDGAIGRPLGIVHVYQPWATPVKTSVLAGLAATGAIPLIDWTCESVADVISGADDAFLTSYADSLRTYGRPVFLRWFWEMNLTTLPRTQRCLGTLGGAGYVQAWQHIWTIFQHEGATNVAFVWCPSVQNLATDYYPGDAYVDWIGWDGYDRTRNPAKVIAGFLPFYEAWAGHGKPLMIGETGATTDQAAYLAALAAALPATMPEVKALVYYDSQSNSDWTLQDSEGNLGFTQFVALGRTPYFEYPFAGS